MDEKIPLVNSQNDKPTSLQSAQPSSQQIGQTDRKTSRRATLAPVAYYNNDGVRKDVQSRSSGMFTTDRTSSAVVDILSNRTNFDDIPLRTGVPVAVCSYPLLLAALTISCPFTIIQSTESIEGSPATIMWTVFAVLMALMETSTAWIGLVGIWARHPGAVQVARYLIISEVSLSLLACLTLMIMTVQNWSYGTFSTRIYLDEHQTAILTICSFLLVTGVLTFCGLPSLLKLQNAIQMRDRMMLADLEYEKKRLLAEKRSSDPFLPKGLEAEARGEKQKTLKY